MDDRESHEEAAQLRLALEHRDIIGQAKGIIRFLTGTSAEEAFALLAKISQDTNIKVRDLAELIAESAGNRAPLPAAVSRSWHQHVRVPSADPGPAGR